MTQSDLLRSIRKYFWKQKFVEVEVPYLNSSLPLESNIYPFKTTWTHQNIDYFLPTSPEFALKEFLSKNKQNCFAVSHCFRDLESSGPYHTPEFLMLEWYEINKNLSDLMVSTKKFIKRFLKTDFISLVLPQNLPRTESDFNQFFLNEIQPSLPRDQAVFITGYPAFLSPLAVKENAAKRANEAQRSKAISRKESSIGNLFASFPEAKKKSLPNNQLASRFELYINGIEIANGCVENRDPVSIKNAFIAEITYRQKRHLPLHPYSHQFIKDCASLPPCSGLGLGLNRLLDIINHHCASRV